MAARKRVNMRAEGFGLRVACHGSTELAEVRFAFSPPTLLEGEEQSGSKQAAVQRKAIPDDMIVGPAKHIRSACLTGARRLKPG